MNYLSHMKLLKSNALFLCESRSTFYYPLLNLSDKFNIIYKNIYT